jgi:ComF family protein
METKKSVKNLAQAALDLLYPPSIYCISCGNLIDATRPYALCDACRERFRWVNGASCAKCGKFMNEGSPRKLCADCADDAHLFEKGFVCAEYSDCRALIHAFKYSGRAYYGGYIARVMRDRLLYAAASLTGSLSAAPAREALRIDLLLPVPMYKKKERKRGYNQADILGAELAKLLSLPYDNGLIERTRDTSVMSDLPAEERGANVKDAFALTRAFEGAARGLRIMLVDDIFTTGSTVNACAETLLNAGASSVSFIVFAAGAGADTVMTA